MLAPYTVPVWIFLGDKSNPLGEWGGGSKISCEGDSLLFLIVFYAIGKILFLLPCTYYFFNEKLIYDKEETREINISLIIGKVACFSHNC